MDEMTLPTADRDWRDRAVCNGVDPEVMQPEEATPDELAVAMKLCRWCPVAQLCEQLAEGQAEAYGIHAGKWHGMPPRNPDTVPCMWCERELERGPRGTRTYCGPTCRKAAQRARELALSA